MVVDEPPEPESEPPVTRDAGTPPAPRPTSVKQIEANRRNALHSTGPTTPEGKQNSRFNALRHGLRAKEVIIPGQENPAELEAILRELREDWEPQGHTEFHLVEQIGLAEWRLRRVHRAELGEIRRQMSSVPERLPPVLGKSTAGIAYQRDAVEEALAELESQGTVSEDTCDYLEEAFRTESDSPVTMLKVWFLGEMPEGDEEETDSESTLAAYEGDKQAAARELLKMTLRNLNREERKLRKQERTELQIARQRMSIPPARELERIQRYETAIKRDLHRTIDLLERLQRRRRGEPTPPTVNVNLSNDD